jgi:hypothetical protein
MRIGVVAGLPSDVERFEPVLRRLGGSDFLLPDAHRPSPRFDARRQTLDALRRVGRDALTEPTGDFDLVLARDVYRPQHLSPWLASWGRLVAWRDPGQPPHLMGRHPWAKPRACEGQLGTLTARVELAFVAASSPVWRLHPEGVPEVVTGDPLAQQFFDVGAAARAHAALGLARDDRPILAVLCDSTRGAMWRWADAVARLRSDHEVVLAVSEAAEIEATAGIPRAWRGPGLHWARSRPRLDLADLLAAATLVLADPGSRARLSFELGRPTLLGVDGIVPTGDGPANLRQAMEGMRVCDDPHHLEALLRETLEEPCAPKALPDRELHRRAADRLADRLCAASQLLVRG